MYSSVNPSFGSNSSSQCIAFLLFFPPSKSYTVTFSLPAWYFSKRCVVPLHSPKWGVGEVDSGGGAGLNSTLGKKEKEE